MLQALLLSATIASYATQDGPIQCDFPGTEAAQRPIHVVLDPKPSLKDQPGLYRVRIDINGSLQLKASAMPIDATGDRDVLVRGFTKKKSMYSIGVRDDGTAALNIQKRVNGAEEVEKSTRIGHCAGIEDHIDRWLPS